MCNNLYVATEVEINHKQSVVPTTGFVSWDDVIERLFCESDGLECVCKPCHKSITKKENEERKINAK